MEEVYPREGVEEASVGGGGSHGQGLRMEADVGLHLFKDSRDGEGCLRVGDPLLLHDMRTQEAHDGTEVSVHGGLTGNPPPGVGQGLPAWPVTGRSLAGHWPWALLPTVGSSGQLP